MTAIPFVLFAVLFLSLVGAHFLPAWHAWRRSRDEQPSDIDPSYVRREDYFARSFRRKVAEWIRLPVVSAVPDGARVHRRGRERIRVTRGAEYAPRSQSDEVLVVQGDFRCGPASTFHREVYVMQNAVVGTECRLQAMAVDGNLALGSKVRITRWVDSNGGMEIGPGSAVAARATSGRSIRLRSSVRVKSAFAPTVTTECADLPDDEERPHAAVPELAIPSRDTCAESCDRLSRAGVEMQRLVRLGLDSLLYEGDLHLSAPVHIRCALIVRGGFSLVEGSVVDGSVKARAGIDVGERCVCRGNLIAGKNVLLRRFVRFEGVVHAGESLRMERGVRGGSEESLVAAYAAGTVSLAEGVVVHGKVAAGDWVVVSG